MTKKKKKKGTDEYKASRRDTWTAFSYVSDSSLLPSKPSSSPSLQQTFIKYFHHGNTVYRWECLLRALYY